MTAPTGIFWQPLTALRTALAAATAFQTWTGAEDAAEALDFIVMFEQDPPAGVETYAVILPAQPWQMLRDAQGTGTAGFSLGRTARLSLNWRLPAGQTWSEENTTVFLNAVGAIAAGVLDTANRWQAVRILPFDERTPLRCGSADAPEYQALLDFQDLT